jgi:hypothetical protein
MQADPAGYGPGMNRYEPMGSDPVNNADPTGMDGTELSGPMDDDLSRSIDFTPRGTGWGSHSWDRMGGIGTHVSGRIDELVDLPQFIATANLLELSYVTIAGGYSRCVRYCTRVQGSGNEIVVQPNPMYAQFRISPRLGLPPSIFFSRPPVVFRPTIPFPRGWGRPGPDWNWKGNGPEGSPQGSYNNPQTGETLHPDSLHPAPKGPHWDYKDPQGNWWRWFGPGRYELKSTAPFYI